MDVVGTLVETAGSVVETSAPDVEVDDTGGAVVVVVDGTGLVQSAGGGVAAGSPGIVTVPAQPKFEKVEASVTVPPSAKLATEVTWRM